VLAYLFWHRPRKEIAREAYERALKGFHRSLEAKPPVGFHRSSCTRASGLAWLEGGLGYEDWYLVEDYAALGVLREAAVARGHRGAHEDAAQGVGSGTAGLYRLLEGNAELGSAPVAVWVDPGGHTAEGPLEALLLGDGVDRSGLALWRRELVLGPAPEYCVLAIESPAGLAAARLPAGWRKTRSSREPIWPV
jgi:hypothetical protein